MQKKQRLLVVTPTPTHPQNAGSRVRIFNLLTMIQDQEFEVHLVWDNRETFNGGHCVQKPDAAAMKACWDGFHEVPYMNAPANHSVAR